jgi:hypothetical protein
MAAMSDDPVALAMPVVLLALVVVVLVLVAGRGRGGVEGYTRTTRAQYKPSFPELVGHKVVVVVAGRSSPRPAPGTVVLDVDRAGVLVRDPRLPWVGMPATSVASEFRRKFGARYVSTSTRDARAKNSVTVVFDASTGRVTKVNVPRQWAMAPKPVGAAGLAVAINPPVNTRLTRPTLVLRTTRAGTVTSAKALATR